MQRGEGSITTDHRTGRKRVRVFVDGKRMTIPGSFESDAQARGALAEFWRLRAASKPASAQGLMTVADWGKTFLDARETDGVHRAVDRDRARWEKRIAGTSIGREYIDTLTAKEVRAWLAEQIRTPTDRGKRPAKQTVLNAFNLLRVALEAAVQEGHIEANPARNVRVPRMSEEKESWDWLRVGDLGKLFGSTALAGEQRRIFTVAIFTGLRKGELWGLRFNDIDFERGELVVAKSYGGPTKGGRVRRVPLLPPALEAIKAQPRRCALVFPTGDVRQRNRNDSAGWETVTEAVGIRRVRFHDLRHTCASHLLQGTWAPQFMDRALRLEEVQRWLGHSSIRVTERYSHLCDEAIRGRVKRSDREPAAEGERGGREWTQVAAGVSEDCMQLAGIIEARTRFERACDGFANRTGLHVIAGKSSEPRPLRGRILDVLGVYARGVRPADSDVVRVLADTLEALPAELSEARHA